MNRTEFAAKLGISPSKEQGARGEEPILISEPDHSRFMAAFATAVAGASDVFLCDPNWGETERTQLAALLDRNPQVSGLRSQVSAPSGATGWLMIPTGGTGGQLKFARHDQDTLAAAAGGFCRHFGLAGVNAAGLLPLHHVSGFMAWMRCVLTGGEYRHLDWKKIEAGELPALSEKRDGWVISLVPTQLERLLRAPCRAGSPNPAVEWLRQFRILFVGGAPAAAGLLDRAAALGLRLSPGYGMTETAAMVTALRPEEFLGGVRSSGSPLEHVCVSAPDSGTITIRGESLFRGYYPEWRESGDFVTADLGRVDERGHLHVLGRADAVIVTGGEKVNPAEVEAALAATGEFTEVVVVGVPDPEWGQAVAAAYPAGKQPDLGKVEQAIHSRLTAYKRPKRYVALATWPLTAAGKVNRAEVARKLSDLRV